MPLIFSLISSALNTYYENRVLNGMKVNVYLTKLNDLSDEYMNYQAIKLSLDEPTSSEFYFARYQSLIDSG